MLDLKRRSRSAAFVSSYMPSHECEGAHNLLSNVLTNLSVPSHFCCSISSLLRHPFSRSPCSVVVLVCAYRGLKIACPASLAPLPLVSLILQGFCVLVAPLFSCIYLSRCCAIANLCFVDSLRPCPRQLSDPLVRNREQVHSGSVGSVVKTMTLRYRCHCSEHNKINRAVAYEYRPDVEDGVCTVCCGKAVEAYDCEMRKCTETG